jgi:hypothetical protein
MYGLGKEVAMKLEGFGISDSQKQSARVAVKKYGYPEYDFEWVRAQDIRGEGHIPFEETVYVIYTPSGFRRMYTGANWETEFEEDLRNQIFTL